MSAASINGGRRPRPEQHFAAFLLVFAAVAALVCAWGCSPRIVEHLRTERDTLYRVQTDSVQVIRRDSIFVREKGDTMYIYKERTLYRDRVRVDTLIRVRVDSVAVERIKEVQVAAPLSFAQRAKIGAFWWLFGAVLALGAWVFRKPILKMIRL